LDLAMAKRSRGPEGSAAAAAARLLADLDEKQAAYQQLHRFYHGHEDQQAKHVHAMLADLCRTFVREMESERQK
jgi:hypothetical protein